MKTNISLLFFFQAKAVDATVDLTACALTNHAVNSQSENGLGSHDNGTNESDQRLMEMNIPMNIS